MLVIDVVLCWGINHNEARVTRLKSAGISLVGCFGFREGFILEVSMPSFSHYVINVCK